MHIHNVGFFACIRRVNLEGEVSEHLSWAEGGQSFRTWNAVVQSLFYFWIESPFLLVISSIFDGEFLGFGVMTLPDSWHSCLPFADLNKICRSKPNSYWLISYCLLVHPLVHEFRWSNPSSGGYQWWVIPRLSMIAGSPRRRTRRIWKNRARPKPGWLAREPLPKWPNFSS